MPNGNAELISCGLALACEYARQTRPAHAFVTPQIMVRPQMGGLQIISESNGYIGRLIRLKFRSLISWLTAPGLSASNALDAIVLLQTEMGKSLQRDSIQEDGGGLDNGAHLNPKVGKISIPHQSSSKSQRFRYCLSASRNFRTGLSWCSCPRFPGVSNHLR